MHYLQPASSTLAPQANGNACFDNPPLTSGALPMFSPALPVETKNTPANRQRLWSPTNRQLARRHSVRPRNADLLRYTYLGRRIDSLGPNGHALFGALSNSSWLPLSRKSRLRRRTGRRSVSSLTRRRILKSPRSHWPSESRYAGSSPRMCEPTGTESSSP